jgi:hypothetical protein
MRLRGGGLRGKKVVTGDRKKKLATDDTDNTDKKL